MDPERYGPGFAKYCSEMRQDGSLALVQVWTVNIDENFRNSFTAYSNNPNEINFMPQAVEELHVAMCKCFGPGAGTFDNTGCRIQGEMTHPAKYCVSMRRDQHTVYKGTGRNLLQMLRESQAVMDDLSSEEVHETKFTGTVINFNPQAKIKELTTEDFGIAVEETYALYTKTGGDKMPSVKPWRRFDLECVVMGLSLIHI